MDTRAQRVIADAQRRQSGGTGEGSTPNAGAVGRRHAALRRRSRQQRGRQSSIFRPTTSGIPRRPAAMRWRKDSGRSGTHRRSSADGDTTARHQRKGAGHGTQSEDTAQPGSQPSAEQPDLHARPDERYARDHPRGERVRRSSAMFTSAWRRRTDGTLRRRATSIRRSSTSSTSSRRTARTIRYSATCRRPMATRRWSSSRAPVSPNHHALAERSESSTGFS